MNNSQGGLWHYLTLWASNGLLLNNDKWGLIYGFSVGMLVYQQLAMNNSQSWVVALFYPHDMPTGIDPKNISPACKLEQGLNGPASFNRPMGCQNFGPADFGPSSNTGWRLSLPL